MELTQKGTVRKRKPKQKITYFTQETEDAILKYLVTDNYKEKNQLFNDKIYYAFYKLAENIIHTFKFYYTEVDDLEDLKFEVMSVLIEKIHLYHQGKSIDDKIRKILKKEFPAEVDKFEKGLFLNHVNDANKIQLSQIIEFIEGMDISDECRVALLKLRPPKAFSYFGTIVKRYLINYNNKNYERIKVLTPAISADKDYYIINDLTLEHEIQDHSTKAFMDMYVEYMDNNLFDIFKKEHELKIADALLLVFKNVDNLDLFNKKAVFLYIKEITDIRTSRHITKVIGMFGNIYNKLYIEYEKYGIIKTKKYKNV